jgi:hypothetical protein
MCLTVFLVSAQLAAPLILGTDCVLSGNVVMNFKEGYLTTDRDCVVHKHQFICEEETAAGVTEDLIPRSEIPRRYVPTHKATERTETDNVTTFQTSRDNSTDTHLTADRVNAPSYRNLHVITERSNEARDADESENLKKYVNGCRPKVSAEAVIIDVDEDDINNNELNTSYGVHACCVTNSYGGWMKQVSGRKNKTAKMKEP